MGVEAMPLRRRIGAMRAKSIGPARLEAYHLHAPDVALPLKGNPLRFILVVTRVEQAKLDPLRVLGEKRKAHASLDPFGAQAPFRLTHLPPAI